MGAPTIITTPSGDKMVVVPLEDYERLKEAAEDLEDLQAAADIQRKLASGEEEFVPAEFVERRIAGESLVRLWREHRGLSVKALAEKCGLTAAYLSQIETGAREGTIETMKKIAGALGVQIDDLV